MDNVEYYLHKARYKFNYIKADYLQRYYSNSKNPRIIQSKITDRLLSLRTCPKDKFFVKPGEFLSVEPKPVFSGPGQAHLLSLAANGSSASENDPKNLKKIPGDNSGFEEYTPMPKVPNLVVSCSCECHDVKRLTADFQNENQNAAKLVKAAKITDTPKSKWWSFVDTKKKRLSEIPLIPTPSPAIEIHSASGGYKDDMIEMINRDPSNQPQENNEQELLQEEEQEDQENQQQQLQPLRRYSYTEGKPPDVWKTVINDISLSAARVSTGGSAKSHSDFTNLKSDLTIADDLISMYNY